MDDGTSFSILIALKILLALFLVFLNAVFVAAEFAFVKVRPTRLAQLVAEGNGRAKIAQVCVNNIDSYLSVSQLGITISSLGLGWLGEPVVAKLLEPLLVVFGITSSAALHSISFIIAFTLVTFLHVVFGELVPKSLAIQRAEAVTLWLAIPMRLSYYLFYPGIVLFNGTANGILRKIGVQPASEHEKSHNEEELQMLVSESYRGGHLDTDEWRLLQNVFEFEKKVVKDIMVPRPEVVFLDYRKSLAENKHKALHSGHTRFPLCDGNTDNVVGLVHIKELFQLNDDSSLDDIKRNIMIIPEGLHLDKLLRDFQQSHQHMALVVDEYGCTAGIVTMENVLEELVGEIQDEFDHEQPEVAPEKDGAFLVDGRLPLEEAAEMFCLPLDDENEYDTLGGYVFGKLGKRPRVGDKVELPGHRLEVAEITGLRIRRIRLNILNKELCESRPVA
ncbi:hemolysin family protein [Desulfallas thermosapovorans]|uniref:CBS domain containing-hemolysin-like protein n=1 Tax=Desulfallas thermosapovorans DSM 6562 TaxID=1121431 RepID=A0A5S4ZVV7_9FIRM|nr:hemolysin family protein [Desulfallas thermosapovorans]TYO96208.1 CBS domain containing-hemolysin-like protein [Desulfallas thermosapovorans DSM 6562]